MSNDETGTAQLTTVLEDAFGALERVLEERKTRVETEEVGRVASVDKGIATIEGLQHAQSEELIRFPGGRLGIALNLDPESVAAVLLDRSEDIEAGMEVRRTGRVLSIPVGDEMLGRVVDPLGRPLDRGGPIRATERRSIERKAPGIMDRLPVTVPLQTGIQVIDALIPIGRGQRELIIGDRQTGKTSIAVDTMINQVDKNVLCVYCAVGQRTSAVAKVTDSLRRFEAMENTIVVVATGSDEPGLNFVAPYAATAMAEYFMDNGRDVLIIFDDITRHARSYRELSLLLRRPPGREAYPGDIFYIHSRLLERATHLSEEHGGGSLTALPIVETQQENISAYIPTNLVSITDGQIYLSPSLYSEGVLPPVDVGESVSRVGGKTQLPAYQAVAGDLKLSYSQFQELEVFSRFGTQLEEETRRKLERGRRVREVFKQPRFSPIPVPEQIAVLFAVTNGLFDQVALEDVGKAKEKIREATREKLDDVWEHVMQGERLSDEDKERILEVARAALDLKE